MTKEDQKEQVKSKQLIKYSMTKAGPLYQNPRSLKFQTWGQLKSETKFKKQTSCRFHMAAQFSFDQPKVVTEKALFFHRDFSEYSNSETASKDFIVENLQLAGFDIFSQFSINSNFQF